MAQTQTHSGRNVRMSVHACAVMPPPPTECEVTASFTTGSRDRQDDFLNKARTLFYARKIFKINPNSTG